MKLKEIERCKEIALRRFGVAPEVTVNWNLNGLTAGYCFYKPDGTSEIRLNQAMAIAEGDAFNATIAHEYAHAVDWALDVKEGKTKKVEQHGARWAQIMNNFGLPATRCHSYQSAVAVRHVEKFKYRCGCGPVQLVGPKVHRKLQNGSVYV